jgi:MscS family membrane protein
MLRKIIAAGLAAQALTSLAAAATPDAIEKAASKTESAVGSATINFFARVRELIVSWTGEGGWITAVQIFAVVFVALMADLAQRRISARIQKRLEKTENPWDDAIARALATPISLLIWILGILQAIAFLHVDSTVVHTVVILAFISSVAWFILRLVKNVQDNLLRLAETATEEDRWDPTTVIAIGKLLRLTVGITALLVAFDQVGINISAALAAGGIGGIAIGFAAKDLLANFFGGLMIFLDRPFVVGEWIRSPDREIEGTVEYIGWRLTRIRTFDRRPLFVPNSIFTTIAVENPQRMQNRRIYETIGIRYDDIAVMGVITADVEKMLKEHPEIDPERTLMVNFNSFGSSSVDFFVYTFTKTTNWAEYHKVKHDVLLKISEIITAHGAEIAYPTSTLHIASAPGEAAP